MPETLIDALDQLAAAYTTPGQTPTFRRSSTSPEALRRPAFTAVSRPAAHEIRGGAYIYLKREDLNHTGAHKINNAIGQVMLAQRMNKMRVIAETGAGQHGVATATAWPVRHRMHGLHGRRRHPAPEAQRLQHEDAGGDGRPGDDRLADLA